MSGNRKSIILTKLTTLSRDAGGLFDMENVIKSQGKQDLEQYKYDVF